MDMMFISQAFGVFDCFVAFWNVHSSGFTAKPIFSELQPRSSTPFWPIGAVFRIWLFVLIPSRQERHKLVMYVRT